MAKTKSKAKTTTAFNLLAADNVMPAVQESLLKLYERRKNKTISFADAGMVDGQDLPLGHFILQYLFGRKALPAGRVIEVVGKTGVGKSTLALYLAGMWAAQANVPTVHVETEQKPMAEEHILRILHSNPTVARAIYTHGLRKLESLEISSGLTMIEEAIWSFRGKVHTADGAALPATVPVNIVIDTASKWMSPTQATGRLEFGDFANPKARQAMKEAGEGSNFEHAKLFAWWGRTLPALLRQNNVTMTVISHQNDKIDMSGTPSFIPKIYGDMHNTTKIGGRAIDQNASFQLVVVPLDQSAKRSDGTQIGTMVRVCMNKNSYGPNNRYIDYELRNEFYNDTEQELEHPLRFDEALARWFATEGILGTSVERNLYTSRELGVQAADGVALSRAFHANETAMQRVGRMLRIVGYGASEEAPEAEAKLPPPPPPEASDAAPGSNPS